MCKVKSVRKRGDTWIIKFDCDVQVMHNGVATLLIRRGEKGTLNITQASDEVAVFKKVAQLLSAGKLRKAVANQA